MLTSPHIQQLTRSESLAHGFSAAGAAALFGTARTPQGSRSLGNGQLLRLEQSIGVTAIMPISSSVYTSAACSGVLRRDRRAHQPIKTGDAIADINPRPILLVYGTYEPQIDAQRLLEAAENGTLWTVEGVGHGGYMQAYPDEAREIIAGFHVFGITGGRIITMALPAHGNTMTAEKYIEFERRSVDIKHEYIHGYVVAMAGASRKHSTINFNTISSLHAQLRGNRAAVLTTICVFA